MYTGKHQLRSECLKTGIIDGLRKTRSGGWSHYPPKIWSWGQKLHMVLTSDRCQSNGNDHLAFTYSATKIIWPDKTLTLRWKNGSGTPVLIWKYFYRYCVQRKKLQNCTSWQKCLTLSGVKGLWFSQEGESCWTVSAFAVVTQQTETSLHGTEQHTFIVRVN